MRYLAICLILFASMAEAGESRPYGPAARPAAAQMWMGCRVTIARPGRPMGSLDVVVYTGLTPRGQVSEADVSRAFSAYVEKAYGVRGGVDCASANSEADAQRYLDHWTTNKNNPSQITVVNTGWNYSQQ